MNENMPEDKIFAAADNLLANGTFKEETIYGFKYPGMPDRWLMHHDGKWLLTLEKESLLQFEKKA